MTDVTLGGLAPANAMPNGAAILSRVPDALDPTKFRLGAVAPAALASAGPAGPAGTPGAPGAKGDKGDQGLPGPTVAATASAIGAVKPDGITTTVSASGALSVGNVSTAVATAAGSTTARSLAARSADALNARDFGAVGDGTTSDGAALSACAAAAAVLGKDMYVPGGTFVCLATSSFGLRPGVTVHLDKRAILLCKSNGNLSSASITNNGVAGDYTIIGGTLQGEADTNQVYGGHNLYIYNAGSVVLDGVTSRYSRLFGLAMSGCTEALVRGCRVYRSLGDGIAVWDTPNARIVHNNVEASNDDSISAHTNNSTVLPRSGVVIADNTIADSQGIRVLGAKLVTITGNVLRRIMSIGVFVGTDGGAAQGGTTAFAVKIANNQISDVFLRPDGRNGAQGYIYLNLGYRIAGPGAAPPGDPAPGTGAVIPLVGGSGAGALYIQASAGAQAAAFAVDVTNNILLRTKPACTNYADWGGAATRWIGDQATGSGGLVTTGIPEANLQTDGIRITGALRRSRIGWNTIRTSGANGISIGSGTGGASGDYDGLDIVGNDVSNFGVAGVIFNANTLLNHQVRLRHNTFDADPEFRHASRARDGSSQPTGAWASGALPGGIWAPLVADASYEGNHFRNVNYPIHHNNQPALFLLNTYFGNCPALNAVSNTNVGIGYPRAPGLGWVYVQEDADPRSATYGQILAAPTPPLLATADAAATYAALAGATFTGAVTSQAGINAGTNTSAGSLTLNGATTSNRLFTINAAGVARWKLGAITAETGTGNTGSDLIFNRYNDLGASLGTAIGINRATGVVTLGVALPVASGGTGATTATLARAAINQGVVALTSGASVATDASTGNAFSLTLDTNATLANPANLAAGASYVWTVKQDATGSRTLAFGSAFKWPGGAAPALSTAPGAADVIAAVSDGTVLYAVMNKAFA